MQLSSTTKPVVDGCFNMRIAAVFACRRGSRCELFVMIECIKANRKKTPFTQVDCRQEDFVKPTTVTTRLGSPRFCPTRHPGDVGGWILPLHVFRSIIKLTCILFTRPRHRGMCRANFVLRQTRISSSYAAVTSKRTRKLSKMNNVNTHTHTEKRTVEIM